MDPEENGQIGVCPYYEEIHIKEKHYSKYEGFDSLIFLLDSASPIDTWTRALW